MASIQTSGAFRQSPMRGLLGGDMSLPRYSSKARLRAGLAAMAWLSCQFPALANNAGAMVSTPVGEVLVPSSDSLPVAGASLLSLAPIGFAQSMGSTQVAVVPDETDPLASTSATRLDYRSVPASIAIALPLLDGAWPEMEPAPDGPLQVGFPRSVPETHRGDLLRSAQWTVLADGTQVMSITLQSADAGRLRVALQAELPDGARVRFFAFGSSEPIDYPVYSRKDFASRGADRLDAEGAEATAMLWSPIMSGDTLGMEVELPPGVLPIDARLRIVRVSHIVFDSALGPTGETGAFTTSTANCPLVDVACEENLADVLTKAVTRTSFSRADGHTYLCSGTVLNTNRSETDNVEHPYVLTAHHCFAKQAEADTAEFNFFFANRTCDGTELSGDVRTLRSGARLLVTDPSTDLALLELRSPLPSGALLAGWSVALAGQQDLNSDVASVNHPNGEPQKYSSGHPAPGNFGVPYGWIRLTVWDTTLFVDVLHVEWDKGHSLGGSSGGGMFAFDDTSEEWSLIGGVSGVSDVESCATDVSAGRFDMFYVNEAQTYLTPGVSSRPDDHGGSRATARRVSLGNAVDGRIDDGADADMFRIVVTESGRLILSSTGDVDTVGRLISEDGTVIEINDDADSGNRNFRIDVRVDPGVYYIRVSGYNPDFVGDYRLHTAFTAPGGNRNDRLQARAYAIAPVTAIDESWVRLRCEGQNDCPVTMDCADQSGAEFMAELDSDIAVGATRELRASDILELFEASSWSGRLACLVRGPERVSAQVWTESGDNVLVNNTAILTSTFEDGSHVARANSLPAPSSPSGNILNLRIRCESAQTCENVSLRCFNDTGVQIGRSGLVERTESGIDGGRIPAWAVAHLQANHVADIIEQPTWTDLRMSCAVESQDPISVQILTRSGGPRGPLVNNTALSLGAEDI